MASIYAKYSVNAFKFRIVATFIPNGTEAEAANCIFYVQYMPIDLINAPTSENDIQENNNCRHKLIPFTT